MFDEVTKREGGKRAAKRGAWVVVSSGVQALLIVAIIVVSTKIAAEVAAGPVVDVKFVKQSAPPPPPPPPPAPRRKTPPRPKTEAPKPQPRPNPMAMVQPKEIPQELKPPNPNEPPEPEYDEGPDDGAAGGVVGGVVGSTGAAPSQGGGIEDAPVYATAGFKSAGEADRGCVGKSVRVPRELAGIVSSITVKFSVNRDGSVGMFQVMGQQPDPRIGQAVWQAIQNCRFNPGADPQGRPVNMWVILPLRFASG